MNIGDLFIKASRMKLRFTTSRGSIAPEDLWDLPLESNTGKINLNQLAIAAFNSMEQTPTVSFVTTTAKKDEVNEVRLEILKYVIATKQVENAAKVQSANKAEEKRRLLEILNQKENAELESLSKADVLARIAAL